MSESLLRLISRYELIYKKIGKYIGGKKGLANLTTSIIYKRFKRRQEGYIKILGKYLGGSLIRSGVSSENVESSVKIFKDRFREKQEASIERLQVYRRADVKMQIRVAKVGRDGKIKFKKEGSMRALKGFRKYDEKVKFEAREVAVKAFSESKNEGMSSKSDYFLWVTRNDSRVRHLHREFHGKRFRFSDPPKDDRGLPVLPGEAFGCRCEAKSWEKAS